MNNSGNVSNQNDDPPFSSVDAEVKEALSALRQDYFAPGFEDRAMARWNRERAGTSSTFAYIERRAWQLVPLAVAASLLLAVYSARENTSSNASLVARALGWGEPVSVASAGTTHETYESVYSTLYGLPLVNSTGVR